MDEGFVDYFQYFKLNTRAKRQTNYDKLQQRLNELRKKKSKKAQIMAAMAQEALSHFSTNETYRSYKKSWRAYVRKHSKKGERSIEEKERAEQSEREAAKAKAEAEKAKKEVEKARKQAEKVKEQAEKEKAAIRRRWKIRTAIFGGSGIAIVAITFAFIFFIPNGAVREIVVDLEEITILVGDKASISATARDADGYPVYTASINWTSNNNNVAKVEEGTVEAFSEGAALISASCDGYVARTKVVVKQRPRCAKVKILNGITILEIHTRHHLKIKLFDKNDIELKDRDVMWTSTKPEIAGVGNEGYITAFKEGPVEITATCDDGSESLSLRVFKPIPSRVDISGEERRVVTEGRNINLNAKVILTNGKYAANRIVQWKSSNTRIAEVDQSGNVTTKSAGSVTIFAECEGKSNQVTFQVRAAVRRVDIVSDVTAMYPDCIEDLTVRVFDRSGNELHDRAIRWSVDDSSVATVDAKGTLISKRVGYVVVTAVSGSVTDTHRIRVVPEPPPKVKTAMIQMGENILTLEFNRRGSLTSLSLTDAYGVFTVPLPGSGSASPSGDENFAWELNVQYEMVFVQLSRKFWVTRSGEVHEQTLFGPGTVGEADFWE